MRFARPLAGVPPVGPPAWRSDGSWYGQQPSHRWAVLGRGSRPVLVQSHCS